MTVPTYQDRCSVIQQQNIAVLEVPVSDPPGVDEPERTPNVGHHEWDDVPGQAFQQCSHHAQVCGGQR